MEKQIHIEGYIKKDEDGILISEDKVDDYGRQLLCLINEGLDNSSKEVGTSTLGILDEDYGGISFLIKSCKLAIYYSKNKESLDEVKTKNVIKILGGDIDGFGDNYGYSEFTIEGMSQELMIGGHDIQKELADHLDDYVHMIIEYN